VADHAGDPAALPKDWQGQLIEAVGSREQRGSGDGVPNVILGNVLGSLANQGQQFGRKRFHIFDMDRSFVIVDGHANFPLRLTPEMAGVAMIRAPYSNLMVNIDNCLNTLRRLVAAGDMNGLPLAERAIEEYWAATPLRARKSGLLYIQQILHDQRDSISRASRDVEDALDAYIERKLAT
jgi:hypothetical protein